MYKQSSRDHGTLGFFQSLLNRKSVKHDPKAAVDATLEFLCTVVTGHFIGCACEILGISKVQLNSEILKGGLEEQYKYISELASQVVDKCTLIEQAYTGELEDGGDHVFNYAKSTVSLRCSCSRIYGCLERGRWGTCIPLLAVVLTSL